MPRLILLHAAILMLGSLLSGCHPASLAILPDLTTESPAKIPSEVPITQTIPPVSATDEPAASLPQTTATAVTALTATAASSPPSPPTPRPTMTVTRTPTAAPIGPCSLRKPYDDLLVPVTLTYGLSREFVPTDLLPLTDELSMEVTLGYPSEIREVAYEPLVQMINDMHEAGLHPQIISAYRSYGAQAIAWNKWNELYPERAAIISAPPGYSEHQLGTVIDFGSPELAAIVGEEDIEFHTYFYKTSEGSWLAENAHQYGFTLSFPAQASEISGFYYEPWHFRYVGQEMATMLHDMGTSLTELQLSGLPEPCVP